ncbi:MAG: DUF5067 domain-containing protein [Oscillospiraceae bacterium]|nr:DUF5067 domain-containing protein [Oscillospiraceae bacterium]
MYCKHCGKEISETAKFCDSCGKPVAEEVEKTDPVVEEAPKKKKKKRHPILATILIIFGVILIIGALSGGSDEPSKVGSVDSATSTQPPKSEFTVGDKVELNDIVVTLVNVSENNGGNYMVPQDGKVFVVCEFEIENNSDREIAVSSMMSFEAYIDDYSTQMNLSAMLSTEKSQLDGSVAPGKKMNGVIGYEADAGWSNIEVRFTPDFWAGKDIIFTYSK